MEKLELAEEFGMNNLATEIKKEQKEKCHVDEITAMNFKIINEDKIRKKLKIKLNSDALSNFGITFILGAIFSLPTLVYCLGAQEWGLAMSNVFIWMTLAVWYSAEISQDTLGLVDITEWKHDIPMGAFYAMKEAKEKLDISKFCIYYPKAKKDPMICGRTEFGVLIEIFSWDDGKVYE